MGIETFKVNLSGSVAAGGTFLVPYPSGMSATNYVTTDAKMVDSAGNVYDATVLLGAGGVTVTNPTGRVIGQKDMGHLQLTTDDVGPANSDVTGGPVYANAAGTALTVNGVSFLRGTMANGVWMIVPSIFRLRLTGTGTCTVDARDALGNITTDVASYTVSGATDQIEFPYAGDDAVEIRATLTGTCTAEVI